jgi:hypothetical protein
MTRMKSIAIHITAIDGGNPEAIADAAADAILALGGTPELDAALALAHTLVTEDRHTIARRRMLELAAAPLRAQLAEIERAIQ